MGLTRVQATPQVRSGNTTVVLTFASPPTVGNAIVVPTLMYGSGTLSCADNWGNTYALVESQLNASANGGAYVFLSSSIVATGSPFSVTVTVVTASSHQFEASAIEVGGLTAGAKLIVDRTVKNFGTAAAAATGSTLAIGGAEVFVVAALALTANQTSITVEVVSPPWLQEIENFSYTASIAGETDSRVVATPGGATTLSCSWTYSTSAQFAAVLVAFRDGALPTVVLLIGAETSVVDESSYARALTLSGNAARTLSVAKYGAASLTFDGVGDWISTPDSADFAFGSGNFTIEGWFRPVSRVNQDLCGQWDSIGPATNSSWFIFNTSGGVLTFIYGQGGSQLSLTGTWNPTLGQWYHIAVDRSGNTLRMYVGGVVVASTTITGALNDSNRPLTLGAIDTNNTYPTNQYNGQMDEVRISTVAQYAGAFTPPTGPFPRPFGVAYETRVTQDVIEVLVQTVPAVRVTQEVVEVLVQVVPALRVTQHVIEVLTPNTVAVDTSQARLSQLAVEVLVGGGLSSAMLAQLAVEVLVFPNSALPAKLSQVAVEVLYLPGPGVGGVGGIWLGDGGSVIWIE